MFWKLLSQRKRFKSAGCGGGIVQRGKHDADDIMQGNQCEIVFNGRRKNRCLECTNWSGFSPQGTKHTEKNYIMESGIKNKDKRDYQQARADLAMGGARLAPDCIIASRRV